MRSERGEYLIDQYRKLHATKRYGTQRGNVSAARRIASENNCGSAIDYGCGQSDFLRRAFPEPAMVRVEYDPAIPGKDVLPDRTFDFLNCGDVAEHIPEEDLPEFFMTAAALAPVSLWTICLVPARWRLPDGGNCHETVKPAEWWEERLREHYDRVIELEANATWVTFECHVDGYR